MKTLYLVRHATAVKRSPDLPDFQRPLLDKGEKEAASMAKKLKKMISRPDLLISSPAARALETAHIFSRRLGYPLPQILIKDSLYEDLNEDAFLYILNTLDDSWGSVMIFGHDPVFSDFASFLIQSFDEPIPKCGVVNVEFPVDSWKNISAESGRLKLFDYPKKIAKHFKSLKKGLKTDLTASILNQLGEQDPKAAKAVKQRVKKSADRIIDEFIKTARAEAEKKEAAAVKSKEKSIRTEKSLSKKKSKKEKAPEEAAAEKEPLEAKTPKPARPKAAQRDGDGKARKAAPPKKEARGGPPRQKPGGAKKPSPRAGKKNVAAKTRARKPGPPK